MRGRGGNGGGKGGLTEGGRGRERERGQGEQEDVVFTLLKGTVVQDLFVLTFCIKLFLWVPRRPKEDSFDQTIIFKILITAMKLRIQKNHMEHKQTTALYKEKKLGKNVISSFLAIAENVKIPFELK